MGLGAEALKRSRYLLSWLERGWSASPRNPLRLLPLPPPAHDGLSLTGPGAARTATMCFSCPITP
jgi:hypothetical protein